MKYLYSLAVACPMAVGPAHASICTTIADGDFLSPATWNCGCDPITCDTLIIMNDVGLGSDVALASSLYVNGGSITGPWELSCSSILYNSGIIAIRSLSISYPCAFTNTLTIEADRVVGIASTFNNAGTIDVLDTMRIYSVEDPISTGTVSAEVIDMAPMCNNYGMLDCERLHFGILANQGGVICRSIGSPMNPIYNSGFIYADTLVVEQLLENSEFGRVDCSMLILTGDLENYGTLRVYGIAGNGLPGEPGDMRMYDASITEVQNYIGSAGSVLRGPGTLCIAGHSENHGAISGPIRICDTSPSNATIPFMDTHDGTLAPPIYGCGPSDCATVGVAEELSLSQPTIFPQPANGSITVQLGDPLNSVNSLWLLDPFGRVIRSHTGPFATEVRMNVTGTASDIYLLQGLDEQGRRVFVSKVIIAND